MNLPILIVHEEQAIPPDRVFASTVFVHPTANISAIGARFLNRFEFPP
jgi:hypothetical protein